MVFPVKDTTIASLLAAFVTIPSAFAFNGVERARAQVNKGAAKPLGPWWGFLAKYIFTGVALFILVMGIVLGGI
ncbi:neurotransmitter:Na+ symporter, NSS family [Desulforamulus putei DSM 12395]|uniref:Neurotransmitter:Na+ symporter, NSS family n=1 Tax=Desulforamulus putei DSM 12395 TaxID=1121429 RepID=A0A1M5A6W2_9FIRM|nr:hypothetical protein [Desulforamulus putei]SHF25894.1 neurotransmitter:Na+ symporter, NSS family [Desulforamulus putei DSM 12395]